MEMDGYFVSFLLLCAFLIVVIWTFFFIRYSGLASKLNIDVVKPPVHTLIVFYKSGIDMQKRAGALTETRQIAREYGLRYCVINYNTPTPAKQRERHKSKAQWCVGCIAAEGRELLDMPLTQRFDERGYRVLQLPHVSSVVLTTLSQHPLSSISLDAHKVYPHLVSYIQKHRLCAHPSIEIHDDHVTYYMMPLARQSDFYVPDSSLDDVTVSGCSSSADETKRSGCFAVPRVPRRRHQRHEKLRSTCPVAGASHHRRSRNASAPCSQDSVVVTRNSKPVNDDAQARETNIGDSNVQTSNGVCKEKTAVELPNDTAAAAGDNCLRTKAMIMESDSDTDTPAASKSVSNTTFTTLTDGDSVSATMSASLLQLSSDSGSDGGCASFPDR